MIGLINEQGYLYLWILKKWGKWKKWEKMDLSSNHRLGEKLLGGVKYNFIKDESKKLTDRYDSEMEPKLFYICFKIKGFHFNDFL